MSEEALPLKNIIGAVQWNNALRNAPDVATRADEQRNLRAECDAAISSGKIRPTDPVNPFADALERLKHCRKDLD